MLELFDTNPIILAILALVIPFVGSLIIGLKLIAILRAMKAGQPIRTSCRTSTLTGVEAEKAKAEIRAALGLLYDRNYICKEIGQAGQVPAPDWAGRTARRSVCVYGS